VGGGDDADHVYILSTTGLRLQFEEAWDGDAEENSV
jgi:hypothetical protein